MFNKWKKTSKRLSLRQLAGIGTPDSCTLKYCSLFVCLLMTRASRWDSKFKITKSPVWNHFPVTIFFSTTSSPYRPVIFWHISFNSQGPYFDEIHNTNKTGIYLILFVLYKLWLAIYIKSHKLFQKEWNFSGKVTFQIRSLSRPPPGSTW